MDPRIEATNSAGYESPAAITADPVVLAPLSGRLCVLLVKRESDPFAGRWSLPGGFLNPDELPEETAQRKLTEKTGLSGIYMEQLRTFGDPDRDPRGWIPSIAYLALISAAQLHGDSGGKWFPVDELPTLAFDHKSIVGDAVDRLHGKLWYSNIASGLLADRFTMPQARALYEAISGVKYEPSNFRRELLHSGLVSAAGEVVKKGPGRPAHVYEFVDRTPTWSERRSRLPAAVGSRSKSA